MHVAFVTLALVLSAAAAPRPLRFGRRQDFALKNGQDAIALNEKFKGLTENSPCTAPEDACVGDSFAQCVNGKFAVQPCAAGTICAALPLVNSAGTSITCTTAADRDARIAATGATGGGAAPPPPANGGGQQNGGNNNGGGNNGGNNGGNAGQNNAGNGGAAGQNNAGNNGGAAGGGDPQTSLTLDPDVIAKGFASNGADAPDAGAGVVPSITSTNNFINFCKNFLPNTPITDGKQIESGSCNPTPMGQIPAKANMPSSKFQFPVNFQKINVNEPFQIKMAINNLETGFFTNAKANYYSGPQQLNDQGIIKGHSHVVIEKIDSFTATQPNNPSFFEFFLGLNGKAEGNVLTADVTKGLTKVGFYKLSSINAAANHQPVLAPVAQHGSLDDAVYFEVVEAGANNGAAGGAAGGAAAPAAPANLQGNTGSNKKGSNKKAAKKN